MAIQVSWLLQGFFKLSDEDQHNTTTHQIQTELCSSLGLPAGSLRTKMWPGGPAWKCTFWWREGDTDYTEAQFYMNIPAEYPVLSLGVSVEKGFETDDSEIPVEQQLDRQRWDWSRLIEFSDVIVGNEIPSIATALRMPVTLRFTEYQGRLADADSRRAFTFVGDQWFQRHTGAVKSQSIAHEIARLDQLHENWIDSYIAVDLSPQMVDGLSAREVATMLVRFDPIRRRLRGRST